MTVEYSCIFGISDRIPGLQAGEQFMRMNDGWTLVVIPGKEDVVFWFLVQKLDRLYSYEEAPRYTAKDAAAQCQRYFDEPIGNGNYMRDLWAKQRIVNMTALQESTFQTWSCGRLVCIGDSIHKVCRSSSFRPPASFSQSSLGL